jgi:hypothetical protein
MSRWRSLRSFGAILAVVAACACGDSDNDSPTGPTSDPPPSGVANISGSWNGTSDFEQPNNQHLITNISLTVTQNDRSVSGNVTFTASNFQGWRGTFSGNLSGPVDTEFVGTVSLQAEPTTGTGVCTGQMTMNGRVTSSQMRWDSPTLTMTPSTPSQQQACVGTVRNIAWIFRR